MPFDSITGRAALCRRGGLASAAKHRATGWRHQKRITKIAKAHRDRQRLTHQLSDAESLCESNYGITLLEYIQLRDAGLLNESTMLGGGDSPRSKKGK